jgi:Bacterial pre-peptidase C-terminal domain
VTTTISQNISSIIADYYLKKAQANKPPDVAPDPYDKEPSKRNIRGYKQSSQDVSGDSLQTARHVGELTRGKTRLNVVSALTKGDLVDFFKFNATANQKLGVAVTTDKGVHLQVLDSRGTVIADSEATVGDKKTNFDKLGGGLLDIKKGDYYIKVTRPTGTSRDVKPNYAIQISTTRYYESDFDTTETPAPREINGTTRSVSAFTTNSILNQLGFGRLFSIKI